MDKIIDCKSLANELKEKTKADVLKIKNEKSKNPTIASILVGDDGGSIYYQNSAEKTSKSLGIDFEKIVLSKDTTEEQLLEKINSLNNNPSIDGIMLLLPLPKQICEKNITNAISPKKDIDCLSDNGVGKFYKGEDSFIPCTPESVITIAKSLDIDLTGKNVVIIGRSNVVGKPLAELFLRENATVTICHSRTKDIEEISSRADILVVAVGKPKLINRDYVKNGAVVIDVGTSSLNGKITGDVDLLDVYDKVSSITSVPGGVGTLTTTILLRNVCKAIYKNAN